MKDVARWSFVRRERRDELNWLELILTADADPARRAHNTRPTLPPAQEDPLSLVRQVARSRRRAVRRTAAATCASNESHTASSDRIGRLQLDRRNRHPRRLPSPVQSAVGIGSGTGPVLSPCTATLAHQLPSYANKDRRHNLSFSPLQR